MTRRIDRRQALAASAASLGYFYLAPAFSAAKLRGANGKVYFAGIGIKGKGDSDIDNAAECTKIFGGEIVAICDIDEGRLNEKANQKGLYDRNLKKAKFPDEQFYTKAKKFTDFRKIFDDASLMKSIDAFTVSTPDHTHTLPSVLAMRAGKHVYCQKPLTHDVAEAHLMRAEAKKNKVCTQMGNQGTAANGLRRAAELLRAGTLGDVTEVHVWTNRPVWPQAPDVTDKKPPKKADKPAGIHWDEFLGPAPEREFAQGIHPFNWRGYLDFGTGAIGDMACHTANMVFMGLNLGHPIHVSGTATDLNALTYPSAAHVMIQFPARDKMVPVTLHWYEGKHVLGEGKDGKPITRKVLPPDALVAQATALSGKPLVNSGSIVVGSKGIAYSPDDYGSEVFFSTGQKTNGGTKPETMPVNGGGDLGQKKEWVEAILANKPEKALSNFDYAGLLTAAFLLGNVAIRTGKAFDWDGEKGVASIKEAAPLIRREYRKGWDLIGYNA